MDEQFYLYSLKESILTDKEKEYYYAISRCLPNGYLVLPQINLATIIKKNGSFKYQNELFRNVDACIFDMSYRPIVVIEINDSSHEKFNRKQRDVKVKNICEEAGIKVVNFWTKYGVNYDYISKTINEAIVQAPLFKRVKHSNDSAQNDTDSIQQPMYSSPQNFNQQAIQYPTHFNQPIQNQQPTVKKGCYVATSVYGSYDCPSVWVLRRFRDYKLDTFLAGRLFIRFYYAASPKIVSLFGNMRWFNTVNRKILDRFIKNLQRKGYSSLPYDDKY